MPATSLKILIVDNAPADLKQVEAVVHGLGHRTVLAEDGPEAIEKFQSERPDLVFMDIMMPGMDGITAIRKIREIPSETWTPVIYFSAPDAMQDIVDGLESGDEDFVAKPASPRLLRAKINVYARMIHLQREVQRHAKELTNWRAEAEEQASLGAHVMASLTAAEGLFDPMLRHFNIPAETFSGDLLCAARAPSGVLNIMLADATGHGLAAALSAMPMTQIFYGMTAKGFPLPTIAKELNRKLKAILPADRFVAATLASVDIGNQTVEVWNGGNPEALFMRQDGVVAVRWPAQHPPLGIMPELLFSDTTETVVIQEPGDLVLCSDGLIEAENAAGHALLLDGVINLLAGGASGEARLNLLRTGVQRHLGETTGQDDISCMLASIPLERRQSLRLATTPVPVYQGTVSDWRLDLSYGIQELRYLDVVPAVLGFITQINALKPHQGVLFLIVSELFNNALDHGLLQLDSNLKGMLGGFEVYMQQRMERLAQKDDGQIDITFLIHQDESRAVLDVSFTDSGAGFDYAGRLAGGDALEGNELLHGRGIALVKGLCAEVVFSGVGNRVWVRYLL